MAVKSALDSFGTDPKKGDVLFNSIFSTIQDGIRSQILVDRTKPWATEGSKVGQEKTYKDSLANALNNAGNVVNAAAEYGVILISQMYDQTTGLLLQNLFYNSDFGVTGKESASFPLIQQLFRLEKGLNDKQEFLMTATNGIWLESSSGVQTEFMEVRGQLLKYPRSGLTELVAKYKALEGKGKVTAADRDAMVAEFMASGSDAYKKLNGTLFKGTSGQQLVAASLFLSGEELRALCYLNTENMERQAPELKEENNESCRKWRSISGRNRDPRSGIRRPHWRGLH